MTILNHTPPVNKKMRKCILLSYTIQHCEGVRWGMIKLKMQIADKDYLCNKF